jgi:hypothetical protein
MSTSNQLDAPLERQSAQAPSNPEMNLLALSTGASGTGERQPAALSQELCHHHSNAESFLPRMEISGNDGQTASALTHSPEAGISGAPDNIATAGDAPLRAASSGANFDQQLEAQLQTLQKELELLSKDLALLIADGSKSAATSVDATTPAPADMAAPAPADTTSPVPADSTPAPAVSEAPPASTGTNPTILTNPPATNTPADTTTNLPSSIPDSNPSGDNFSGGNFSGGNLAGEIGFYGGAGNPALAEQTSATLGRPVATTDYLDMTQPADQTVNWITSQYSAWQAANPGTPMALGVPLTFQNQTLQETASGANNQEFVDVAQQLVKAGMGNANIRLGWEMNGTWYPWGGDPGNYVNAYNNAAEAMKSVPGANFTFTWNVNNGNSGPAPFQDYYPGGQNVNVIADDAYDNTGSAQTVISEAGGLQDVANFAQQQGKAFAVPEWGLWNTSGDDPSYINTMASFFKSVPNLAWQSYYGDGSTTPLLSANPQSQAAYNQDFSS